MKYPLIHVLSAATVLLAFQPLTSQPLTAGELRAGFAAVDITPPLGYRMSGYFSERLSTGVLDPLLAKALVLEQGDVSAALVICDLSGISADVSRRARRQAAEQTGIPATDIAIAATHSHTGPLYFGALREHFHNRAVEQSGADPYEKIDYPSELVAHLVTVIKQAHQSRQAARLEAGIGYEDRLSFNRRFHMKDGSVRFNPGQLNPDIVRPAGPIDPEVGIIKFSAAQGDQGLGSLVAFALHLDTVGGTQYSADYPRVLQGCLRERFGHDFISLFGAGTCGDINHVDVTVKGRRSAAEIGSLLAETVEQALPNLSAVSRPSLAVRSASVDVPLQQYTAEQIDEARRNMDLVDSNQLDFLKRVEAYKIMALELYEGDTLPIEVQALRLGPELAVVTLPGEVFVDLGIAIKLASPFETTLVIELANDAPGYLPTKKAFAEGSYETVNSRVQPGGGEQMVRTAIELLKELEAAE